jgi:hypothetical protein
LEAFVSLLERTIGLETEKAHPELKTTLLHKGCRIIAEETHTLISAKQGSLWGISPRTAKKVITYRFAPIDSGTRITYSSSLASDWKNLTIIGTALAVFVASLCWWIATDLDSSIVTGQLSYWSWIVNVDGGSIDFPRAQIFADLTRVFAVFLAIIIIVEAVVTVYAYFRINAFAEETLSELR